MSLVLEPADGGELPEIRPGQYVSVFVDLPDGNRQPRQYTMSHPRRGNRLQITVSRVKGVNGAPDGQVSSFLLDQIVVGDLLDVSAPAGDFVVQSRTTAPAGERGRGITTVLPIVEHIARTQPERKVIVAHADRTAQDHALRKTVLHVGRQIDDFTAYTWYETVERRGQHSKQGSWTSPRCRCHDVQVFTCGPLPFMRHVRSPCSSAACQASPNPVRGIRSRPVGRSRSPQSPTPPPADKDDGSGEHHARILSGPSLRRSVPIRSRRNSGCR